MSVRELINILKEIEDIVKSLPFQKEKATNLHFRLVELYSQDKEYEEDNYIYHLIKSVNFSNVEIHTNYVIECMEIFDKISKKVYANPKDECFEKPVFWNDKVVSVFFDL